MYLSEIKNKILILTSLFFFKKKPFVNKNKNLILFKHEINLKPHEKNKRKTTI